VGSCSCDDELGRTTVSNKNDESGSVRLSARLVVVAGSQSQELESLLFDFGRDLLRAIASIVHVDSIPLTVTLENGSPDQIPCAHLVLSTLSCLSKILAPKIETPGASKICLQLIRFRSFGSRDACHIDSWLELHEQGSIPARKELCGKKVRTTET
jgi:hypothetical protein